MQKVPCYLSISINIFHLLYSHDNYNIDNLVKFVILTRSQSFTFQVLQTLLHGLLAVSRTSEKPDVHLIHITPLFKKNIGGDSYAYLIFFSP